LGPDGAGCFVTVSLLHLSDLADQKNGKQLYYTSLWCMC